MSKAERDPALRAAALRRYGMVCSACGFVPAHPSQLEFHHLNPISEGSRRTTLEDVAVLCANCHRLAHARLRDAAPKPSASLSCAAIEGQ